ncbi:hypothetical protein H8D30_02745 [bacterium]|nr:hypothetical protein [bacterium]
MILLLWALPFNHPLWEGVPAPDWMELPALVVEASHSHRQEGLLTDGEVTLVPFRFGGDHWTIEASLYGVHGGWMDGGIASWHQFWGLPEGERPNQQNGDISFAYDDGEGVVWGVDRSGIGISAPLISFPLSPSDRLAISPLPGTGPFDLWRAPGASWFHHWRGGRWEGELGLGWMGGIKLARGSPGRAYGSLSAMGQFPWGQREFLLGVRGTTPLWDGPARTVLEGVVLFRFWGGKERWVVGFSEDLSVGSGADFSLWMGKG